MSTGEICGAHLPLPQPSSFFTGDPKPERAVHPRGGQGCGLGSRGRDQRKLLNSGPPPKMPSDPFLTQIPLPRAVPREMRAAERGGLGPSKLRKAAELSGAACRTEDVACPPGAFVPGALHHKGRGWAAGAFCYFLYFDLAPALQTASQK